MSPSPPKHRTDLPATRGATHEPRPLGGDVVVLGTALVEAAARGRGPRHPTAEERG